MSMHIRLADQLPAYSIATQVNESLRQHDSLVITAPPGAGKSTLLPLTILQSMAEGGKVIVLEPRRLAARQIAERMASMIGEQVGDTVGYRVRFEHKVSARTRIEVVTEGILTRMLVSDPTLEGVNVVIFDEFHERSLNSDLALALTREAQQIIRPDLRIVIMSATIDADAICKALDAPLVEADGRLFPVEVRYCCEADVIRPRSLALGGGDYPVERTAEAVAHMIRQAHQNHEGDILAFLPGEAEIRRCAELLGTALLPTRICPLYGLLSPQQQRDAIAPSREGERKVVLATSIAETSLTIEGVRIVVDSGLCRRSVFDVQNGLSHLQTVRVSQDMATQRSGRAGRVAPGVCYRLWSKATESRMDPCRRPEIEDADLAPMMLDVAAWGESKVSEMTWLTPPPSASVARGNHLLQLLEAVDEQYSITPHGKRLSSLPCHPRIAQMLEAASSASLKALAADIAALLDERDPMQGLEHDSDMNTRIVTLREIRRQHRSVRGWDRILKASQQYCQMCRIEPDDEMPDAYETGALLAAAYPERVAMSVDGGCGRYRLACGDMAYVDAADLVASHDWIAVASLNASGSNAHIFLASPVRPSDLSAVIRTRDVVSWDDKRGAVVARSESRIGCLLVGQRPIADCPRSEIDRVICNATMKDGLSMLDFSDDVQNLQRRVAVVSGWHPELLLPDLSTEAVLARADEWLPLYLGKATTVAELKKIDLTLALWSLLDYNQQIEVDRLAPRHIAVPTGSRIKVEYRQGAELPIVRVRLQECFGMLETPRVDDGRCPVLMELLSPGFKPVQLTQDLHSFWENTYFEVRKELRRRYPKHSWPDNPLEAEAVRGVRRE